MLRGAFQIFRNLPLLAQILVPIIIGYGLLLLLQAAGWYLLLGALGGWTILAASTSRQAGYLPRFASSSMIAAALDWLTEGASPPVGQVNAASANLAAKITADHVRKVLDEILIGQNELNASVAREVEAFVNKRSPLKPLSLLVAGPSGSGRTTFAKALAVATAVNGKPAFLPIQCASDIDIDLAKSAAVLRGQPLPVILLDNAEKIGAHRHGNYFMDELMRALESGMVEGRPLFRNAIIVLTVLADPTLTADACKEARKKPTEANLIMRRMLQSTRSLPSSMVDRIHWVSFVPPLDARSQMSVVWKVFCDTAQAEHQLSILADNELGQDDGIIDFLFEARDRWEKAGVSGVRDAARFVAQAADEALAKASAAGATRVRARWDPNTGRLQFDPAAP